MSKPISWALVARKANGEKIILHEGEWMRENKYRFVVWCQKDRFSIMKLPPELRHEIIKYFPKTNYVGVYLPGNCGMASTLVELPMTARAGDRLLRQETIMITIEQTTFAIHSGPGNARFQAWLGALDLTLTSKSYSNGFDAVKSLDFPYFSRFPHMSLPATTPNSDIELMLKCRQVERVGMVWVGEELHDGSTGQYLAKTVNRLRKEYRLDRMLGLCRVKTLTMTFGRGYGDTTAIDNLAAWFRANMPDVDGRPIVVVVR